MKTIISLCIFLFSLNAFSQVQSIEYVDFVKWTSQNNIQYSAIIVADDFVEKEVGNAIVRVKYTMDGITKIVEFPSTVEKDILENSLDVFIMGGETAQFIKSSGSYTPDNFIFNFDFDGNLIDAFQADHTELDKGDDAYLAEVEILSVRDADHQRELIKEFFTASDSMYRDLMTFAAQFD